MPIYGAAREVMVKPFTGATWFYGFRSKADAADGTLLGHVLIGGGVNPASPVLFGVNNIKPAKARKIKATGETESTFVDPAAETAARAAGWKISVGRNKTPRGSTRSKPMKVKIAAGCFIGWLMPTPVRTKGGAALTTAGLLDIGTAEGSIPFGVNSVLLSNGDRYTRKNLKSKVAIGTTGDSISTYVPLDLTP